MIETKRTTIEISTDTLIEIKAMAVKQGTTQNKIITELINKGLKATGNKEGKLKSRVINHEMLGYKKKKKIHFKDSEGIVEIENPEKIKVQALKDRKKKKKELY
jgi:hypothetical protein